MRIYKTCNNLPIYNFNEILKTSDLRFLIKDFDEFADDNKELTSDQLIELQAIYKDIVYEHAHITSNTKIIANYKSRILIEENTFKYNTCINILDIYSKSLDLDVLALLNRFDWKVDVKKDVETEVKRVVEGLRSLKTKIAILTLKHEERFKDGKNNETTEYVDRLDQEAIYLGLGLKLSYSIDTRKMSVSRWVKMWELCNSINQKN